MNPTASTQLQGTTDTARLFDAALAAWPPPAVDESVTPQSALCTLGAYVAHGEALLARLAAKHMRTQQERCFADAIHGRCRAARMQFMREHADWLYAQLTQQRGSYLRLDELVRAGTAFAPWLMGTAQQQIEERERLQVDKEGREIDQGIFLWGVLRQPVSGEHLLEAMLRPTDQAQSALKEFQRAGRIRLRTVHLERRGNAAHLSVENQECLNAEDDVLIDDMETAVDLVLLDDETRVGVLRGGYMAHHKYAGKRVFSAGINLKFLHRGRISFVNFLMRRELGYISKILRGLLVDPAAGLRGAHGDKPWVAAVDSFAIGGGAQLLLVFDRVIAAADSFISLPAAQEGIIPGAANLRLSQLVGGRMARQIILGGRRIWAHEPAAAWLIDEAVPAECMDAAIETAVRQLDTAAVRANRRMLNCSEEPLHKFRCYMAQFALEQSLRLYSEDVLAKVAVTDSGTRDRNGGDGA